MSFGLCRELPAMNLHHPLLSVPLSAPQRAVLTYFLSDLYWSATIERYIAAACSGLPHCGTWCHTYKPSAGKLVLCQYSVYTATCLQHRVALSGFLDVTSHVPAITLH